VSNSNVIDLYHNRKIEGGGQFYPPPRQPVSKPDVRLKRVFTVYSQKSISIIIKMMLD